MSETERRTMVYNGEGYRTADENLRKLAHRIENLELEDIEISSIQDYVGMSIMGLVNAVRVIDGISIPSYEKDEAIGLVLGSIDLALKATNAVYLERGSGSPGDWKTDKNSLRTMSRYFIKG